MVLTDTALRKRTPRDRIQLFAKGPLRARFPLQGFFLDLKGTMPEHIYGVIDLYWVEPSHNSPGSEKYIPPNDSWACPEDLYIGNPGGWETILKFH